MEDQIICHCCEFFRQHRIVLGAALLGMIFLLGVLRCRCNCRKKIAVSTGDLGTIAVSLQALRAIIADGCQSVADGVEPKIFIRLRRNGLYVCIRLRALTGDNLQQTAQEIQRLTMDRLHQQFGFGKIAAVDVLVNGFRPTPRMESMDSRPAEALPIETDSED